MKEKVKNILAGVAYLAMIGAITAVGFYALPVEAKQQQPQPCVEIATVGNFTTSQCWDLDNQPYLQNTAGFMTR